MQKPHAASTAGATGCNRYPTSLHCHLAYPAPGEARPGVQLRANQYWLYADDSVDMAAVCQAQDEFLADGDEMQRATAIAELQEKPYQVTWSK